MLQAMLDSHPDLAIPGESYWVVTQARLQQSRFSSAQLLRALQVSPHIQRWGLDSQVLAEVVLAAPSFAEAVRSVYSMYAETRGKPRYADKTPSYVLSMDLLATIFPEAKFIHLIRDGRNVALSVAQGPFGPNDVNRAMLYWRHHVTRGRESGRRLGPRYFEVHYEDLVAEPPAVLKKVCRFVALDYSAQMLEYPGGVQSLLRRAPVPEAHPNLSRDPLVNVRDWRSELTASQGALLERLGGDLLGELGYPLECSALGRRESAWLLGRERVVRGQGWLDQRLARLKTRALRLRSRVREHRSHPVG